MEIVKVGTNTKNAEGIKISREIRKAFETYLKAKQALKETVKVDGKEIGYDKITVEQLYVSYLATFKESEDYKATEKAKKDKEAKNKDEQDKKKEDKKEALMAQYAKAGFTGDQLEKIVEIALQANKKGRKKAEKKAEKKEAEKATEQE